MSDVPVGKVTHYFDRIQVAVLDLNESLKVGDKIRVSGHATELQQTVESLQIDHKSVLQGDPGQEIALKVIGRVREHDHIYRLPPTE